MELERAGAGDNGPRSNRYGNERRNRLAILGVTQVSPRAIARTTVLSLCPEVPFAEVAVAPPTRRLLAAHE